MNEDTSPLGMSCSSGDGEVIPPEFGKPCRCYGSPVNAYDVNAREKGLRCARCGHRWPRDTPAGRDWWAAHMQAVKL